MKFAFLQVGFERDRQLAKVLVNSIRETHENAEIVQVSNQTTPEVKGVDRVIRFFMNQTSLMQFRLNTYSVLTGEVVFLDTDIVVQKNLNHVFKEDFEIGITQRKTNIKTIEEDLTKEMPYNGGVVFSRNHLFWEDCEEVIKTLPENRQKWFGDQIAMARVIESGKYKVKVFGPEYNYSAINFQEDVSDKYIVHYKGKRKDWMAYKYQHLLDMKVVVND